MKYLSNIYYILLKYILNGERQILGISITRVVLYDLKNVIDTGFLDGGLSDG